MLFKIECEKSTYYYDNNTNAIFSEDGLAVDQPTSYHLIKNKESDYVGSSTAVFSEDGLVANHSEARHLVIFLGTKCNYHCSYCFQQQDHYDFDFDRVYLFNAIKNSYIDINRLLTVELWGGEPLVYWKRVRDIVKMLREDLQYKGSIDFVSNGSLFDREKREFCTRYRVAVFFSHDGPCQTLYRNKIDFLDDKEIRQNVREFLIEGHLGPCNNKHGLIMPSIGHLSPAFDELVYYFKRILYDDVSIRLAGPLIYNKSTKHILDQYTDQDREFLKKNYKYALNVTRDNPLFSYYEYIKKAKLRTIHRIAHRHIFSSYTGSRNARYDPRYGIAIDTEGNYIGNFTELSSDDHGRVVGNISEGPAVYRNEHRITDKKECLKCPYAVSCRLGCLKLDDQDFHLRCKSHMFFREAIFESAWYDLIGDDIVSISTK